MSCSNRARFRSRRLADRFLALLANVKQVLTIILAVLIFNLSLNPTNLFGITLTLGGGACEPESALSWTLLTLRSITGYARVELVEKSRLASLNANVLPTRPPDAEKVALA